MDEENYRIAREDIVLIPCAFEKSILASRTCCLQSSKRNIADREVVTCASLEYQSRCKEWLQLLREKSQFALQLTDISNSKVALPHGKEMKIQVGGLRGLAAYSGAKGHELTGAGNETHDVFSTLSVSCGRHESFAGLPFESIIKSVVHYRLR
jgi:hypothetical protein